MHVSKKSLAVWAGALLAVGLAMKFVSHFVKTDASKLHKYGHLIAKVSLIVLAPLAGMAISKLV